MVLTQLNTSRYLDIQWNTPSHVWYIIRNVASTLPSVFSLNNSLQRAMKSPLGHDDIEIVTKTIYLWDITSLNGLVECDWIMNYFIWFYFVLKWTWNNLLTYLRHVTSPNIYKWRCLTRGTRGPSLKLFHAHHAQGGSPLISWEKTKLKKQHWCNRKSCSEYIYFASKTCNSMSH